MAPTCCSVQDSAGHFTGGAQGTGADLGNLVLMGFLVAAGYPYYFQIGDAARQYPTSGGVWEHVINYT